VENTIKLGKTHPFYTQAYRTGTPIYGGWLSVPLIYPKILFTVDKYSFFSLFLPNQIGEKFPVDTPLILGRPTLGSQLCQRPPGPAKISTYPQPLLRLLHIFILTIKY